MTALAGLWRFDGNPIAAEGCVRMLVAQKIYGVHGGSEWSDHNGVALGSRLMRTLPEDKFDRQPLIGAGGRYVLVGDIRLDNRDELIKALQLEALERDGLSDSAVLLAGIERWEEACLERLVGDYAFALWDNVRRRILLARDALGQRPLHYHHTDQFLAFASMPKGLHALPEIDYVPDEERIAELLVLMPASGTRTCFRNIERIEPGHVVSVSPTGLSRRRYWHPSTSPITFKRPEDYDAALRDHLDQAVRCRLRGAKRVGVYLSGGIDSGAVAATAARIMAPYEGRVVGFTAVPRKGYDGPSPRNRIIDEGEHASATAALYSNVEHILVRSEGRSPLDDLDRNFYLFDEPAFNLCNSVWWHNIADAMRERKLSVALGGDAGNLTLSYNGLELLPELLRRGRWLRWLQESRALVKRRRMGWRGILANSFGPWCPAQLWVWLHRVANGYAMDVATYSAINPQRLAELNLAARAKERNLDLFYRPWRDGVSMRLWAMQRTDPANYYKGFLGGWQIDYRDPTSDIRLLEFCLRVPTAQFLNDGIQRAWARRALVDRLPKVVLEESRRGLQAADWHEHLSKARVGVLGELDRLEASPLANRALDLTRLRKMVENWPVGGWERDEVMVPYRLALLRAISTGHFLRRATGSNS